MAAGAHLTLAELKPAAAALRMLAHCASSEVVKKLCAPALLVAWGLWQEGRRYLPATYMHNRRFALKLRSLLLR